MCTLLLKNGTGIGFNRDESVLRKKSSFPQIFHGNDLDAVFPVDGDFGGTWIGANSKGRIYALLNYYEKEQSGQNLTSRGLLVKEMILGNREEPADAGRFQPFKMLVMDRTGAVFYKWNGQRLFAEVIRDEWFVAGSSGLLGEKVETERRTVFNEKYLADADWQGLDFSEQAVLFLKSHEPEKGPVSACMHRADAATVSGSVLNFRENGIGFYYKEGNPCENGKDSAIFLPVC